MFYTAFQIVNFILYCVLYPCIQGATEQQQLNLISQLCGSINPESFPGVERLELYNKLELIKGQKRRVKERLKVSNSLKLLNKFLKLLQ